MSTRTALISLLLSLGLLAGGVSYLAVRHDSADEKSCSADPLQWLQKEFRLNAEQQARIAEMHREFSVLCDRHCAEIREARQTFFASKDAGAQPEFLVLLQEELNRLELHCRESTEAHVRAIAEVMDPKQGQRYLDMVLPRLHALDHEGSPRPDLGKHDAHAEHCQ